MRVRRRMQTQGFGAFAGTGPLGKTDKKALLGRQSIGGLQFFTRSFRLPCFPGQNEAAEVGDVLTRSQLELMKMSSMTW